MPIIFRKQEKTDVSRDIRNVVGPLDESIITAILHTGATIEEITQALAWLEENHHTRAVFARRMDERVRHVYDILDYAYNGFSGEEQ